MEFKTPLIPFQKEFYRLMTTAGTISFSIYDSSVNIEELQNSLKNLDEVNFGVISDLSCVPTSAKVDTVIWKVTVRVELFSSYRGRMKVAEMINKIGCATTDNEELFSVGLQTSGYSVTRMEIGESVIGSAVQSGALTWQNGYITVSYWIYQEDI